VIGPIKRDLRFYTFSEKDGFAQTKSQNVYVLPREGLHQSMNNSMSPLDMSNALDTRCDVSVLKWMPKSK
jgi:hypothetical protein